MAIKTLAAVRAICENSGWEVSNLSVQKILYISHAIYLAKHSESKDALKPLIRSSFYAWVYGPVVPDVYKALKMFGAKNIEPICILMEQPYPTHENEFIKSVCTHLEEYTPAQLIAITHRAGGAWDRLYDSGRGDIVIPNEEIYNEYRPRISGN